MRGDIPPLPQYVFMAWCSVKAQGQLYLLPFFYCTADMHFNCYLSVIFRNEICGVVPMEQLIVKLHLHNTYVHAIERISNKRN
jgi:hypothetical protein